MKILCQPQDEFLSCKSFYFSEVDEPFMLYSELEIQFLSVRVSMACLVAAIPHKYCWTESEVFESSKLGYS